MNADDIDPKDAYRAGFREGYSEAIKYAKGRLLDLAIEAFKGHQDEGASALRQAPGELSVYAGLDEIDEAWESYIE